MALNERILRVLIVSIPLYFGIIFANNGYAVESYDSDVILLNHWSKDPMLFQTWMTEGVVVPDSIQTKSPKKVTAVLLAIALGPFGVHRLYLGTEAKVPVIYTLTLGGGLGILPLIDIIAILSNPTLEKFEQNGKIVMWAN